MSPSIERRRYLAAVGYPGRRSRKSPPIAGFCYSGASGHRCDAGRGVRRFVTPTGLICVASLLATIAIPAFRAAEAATRERRYPLAAFRVESPDRVRFTDDQWPAEHIAVDGEFPLGIFAKFGGFVEYRVAEFSGVALEGGYALVAQKASLPGHNAHFRIDLQKREGARPLVLLDEVVRSGGRGHFRFVLPKSLDAEARLTLRIEYGQPVNPGVTPRALWIDPALVWQAAVPSPGVRSPFNVLLITADTTRFDELGCYGGGTPTPALDRLAADGVRFSEAYSVAFGTTPSHASLMTSLPAARHGVYNNWMVLGEQHETLAEVLQAHGYETVAFVSSRPLARALGLAQGFERYEDIFSIDNRSGLHRFALHERRGDKTVALFVDWLEHRGAGPFFGWIHFFDAHQPYDPPSAYLSPSALAAKDEAVAHPYLFNDAGVPQLLDAEKIAREGPERLRTVARAARARYRAEVRFMDAQIGRVRDALIERLLYRNTLVIFAADHGENFLDRNPIMAFAHAGLHREVTHIPLILKVPSSAGGLAGDRDRDRDRAERRAALHPGWRDDLVGNIDVAPTILDTLGIEAPKSWEGQSFRSGTGKGRSYLVSEGSSRQELAVRTRHRLLRRLRKPWDSNPSIMRQLGYADSASHEFYDLDTDPAERKNLYDTDDEMIPELTDLLDQFEREHPRPAARRLLDPRHRAGLEALGYVE